ncbi:MAG: hypothetical protein EOR73_15555 [Mesorhizobium sp.]|nr:MAG: hypothetical protein EOR73_15555 [Mesorhizobium sp.]TIQ12349.1 MAG: hypothetical protein E5X57_13325 [Mesorhizobium sp.]
MLEPRPDAWCRRDSRGRGNSGKLPISPLEGEMSPKATEGVAAREAPASFVRGKGSRLNVPTPSGLPAISPSRGEISASMQTFGMSSRLLHYVGA